ncbi:neuropeptide F receptor-like [Schistocerca piceifrons]|uniref:neuropeptide F receptor-like n=1 Tax=Schistocerca piceifrons TaxID=274613 RepID=UPI001F5F3D26|nr:neuropeptide F receptor-like [Schistocerca piceifrons]
MEIAARQLVLPTLLGTAFPEAEAGAGAEAAVDHAFLLEAHRNLTERIRNLTRVLSALNDSLDPRVLAQFSSNRKLDDPAAFYALVAAYSLLIAVGAAGNSLVVCAVVRKPAMRTARNMFIVNLAVSDLLLCLVTMPLTLMEILTKYWPLGRQPFVCKMLGTLQATSIFVSTISITAIALDRYQVIVYPTRESLQRVGAVVILVFIWIFSLVLALPMYLWRTLKHHDINLPDIAYISYCLEEWPIEHGRAYYSIFSLICQYLLPIVTVTVAYSRICHKLRYRFSSSSPVSHSKGGEATVESPLRLKSKEDRRLKRTNSLLYSIALIFCISWLPLNVFNVVLDLWYPFDSSQGETMIILYAVCHMMGMSSACSNPLLYGWLNENFRKEFREIASCACPCLPAVRRSLRRCLDSLRRRTSADARMRHETTTNGSGPTAGKTATLLVTAQIGANGSAALTTRLVEAQAVGAGAGAWSRRDTDTDNGATGSLQPDTEMTVLSRA